MWRWEHNQYYCIIPYKTLPRTYALMFRDRRMKGPRIPDVTVTCVCVCYALHVHFIVYCTVECSRLKCRALDFSQSPGGDIGKPFFICSEPCIYQKSFGNHRNHFSLIRHSWTIPDDLRKSSKQISEDTCFLPGFGIKVSEIFQIQEKFQIQLTYQQSIVLP